MFSGIIEEIGIIREMSRLKNGMRMKLDPGKFLNRLKSGDSLAVDGVCLTVVSKQKKSISMDISPETLDRTNLGKRSAGERVNLELPVTATSFLSGHMVQGHIDGKGIVTKWKRQGEDVRLGVRLGENLIRYCVPKGSIAINGVSLTIARMKGNIVEIALIPYTLQHTNLGSLQPGDIVNIETDILGKYVVSILKKSYDRVSKVRK